MESVHQFLDIFAKVDENFSGDLDIHEWIRLFTSLDESIPVQEARMVSESLWFFLVRYEMLLTLIFVTISIRYL